jgi:hypothetical protein
MHLPPLVASATVPTTTALLFSGCPAVRTTPWLIGEALGSEELLLGSAKGKAFAAIQASEGFVRIAHG